MPPSARSDIPGIGQTLANLYMQLSIWSYNKRLKLWKLSPKLHLWEHLTEDQAPAGLNPREFWTYGDEDLVGQLIDIAQGVHPATLAVGVLYKWCICVLDEVLLPDVD